MMVHHPKFVHFSFFLSIFLYTNKIITLFQHYTLYSTIGFQPRTSCSTLLHTYNSLKKENRKSWSSESTGKIHSIMLAWEWWRDCRKVRLQNHSAWSCRSKWKANGFIWQHKELTGPLWTRNFSPLGTVIHY